MPLSPPHKRGLLAMHAAGSWRLEGQGGESGFRKWSGLQHGPPHIITIYFLESVRGGRAISSPSPVSLFSADARRAIRFRLSTVYSITVPHVSEIARQRVSPLVSGVRAGLSGLRCVRAVSVPPFPLELAKRRLLGKGLLVAHQFCLLMAHYWCATSTTPLVFFTNGAPLVHH